MIIRINRRGRGVYTVYEGVLNRSGVVVESVGCTLMVYSGPSSLFMV